jgi:hypothetical protein
MTQSDSPTIISFYAGAKHYYDAAIQLRTDCEALGLRHSIVELEVPTHFDWGQICRLKIGFYLDRLEQLDTPVLWIDVDSRIRRAPDILTGCRFDLVGYARHQRYIRDYDRYYSARFWLPGVIYFNNSPRARRFLQYAAKIERESSVGGSDDYFLEEAWKSFNEHMSVGFLPPQTLAWNPQEVNDETIVEIGLSKNASAFAKTMEQHVAPYETPAFRKLVLDDLAADASRRGDREEAAAMYYGALRIDKADKSVAYKLAETLRLSNRFSEAIDVLKSCQAHNPDDHEPTMRQVNYQLQHGDLLAAREALDVLENSDRPASRDFAASRRLRLDLEERARAMGVASAQRTRVWWMEGPYPGNFGDVLTPYLIEKITGIPPLFAPRGRGLLAVGSIIKFAKEGTRVWGSGTPRMTDRLAAKAEYCAVRGPLTRSLVLESGGKCPQVYGDPALLLPRFYRPAATGASHRLGLIPHVSHLTANVGISEEIRLISPKLVGYAAIESFVDAIIGCRSILTSSLHGLIVAHAYGVPARWCTFGDKAAPLAGDGTKFLDYFLSVGQPEQDPLDLSQVEVIDESLARHVDQYVDLQFDGDTLLAAFPAQD